MNSSRLPNKVLKKIGNFYALEILIKRLNEGYFKGVALDVISNESLSNNLDSFIDITNKNLNFILSSKTNSTRTTINY